MGGAGGPVTFRHVVEYCDGWMPIHGRRRSSTSCRSCAPRAEEAGRDPATDRARRVRRAGRPRRRSRTTGRPASSAASSACRRRTRPRCCPSSTATPSSSSSTPEHGRRGRRHGDAGAAERAAIQRRTLRVLTTGQVVGAAALAAAVTVGAFVVQDMLGDETAWAGIATATVTTGTAFMSQVLSRRMQRRGRRPGLQLGYGLAVVGGLIAAVGVERSSLAVFLVGLFVFGNGQAANLLARYAATDLAEPDERGRAMSRIVFASTFGAVLGPLLIGPAEARRGGVVRPRRYTGPWLFSAALLRRSRCSTPRVRLRPDPLVIAGGARPAEPHAADAVAATIRGRRRPRRRRGSRCWRWSSRR